METGQISAAIGNLLQSGKPKTLMNIPTLTKISEEVPEIAQFPPSITQTIVSSKSMQMDAVGNTPAKVKVATALTTEWYGSEELVQLYGPPMSFNSTGIPSDINQMFVAGRFARDNMVLYEPTLNVFYDYEAETGLWKPKTEARLIVELGNALQEMLHEFDGFILLKKRTANLLAQILHFLRGIIEKPDVFQRTQHIIHVGNGVLCLDNHPPTFHEFSHEYYSRNRSEICFNKEAECPKFLGKLLRPALSDDDITLLQRYAGQCLLGRNPSQRFLLLRGSPGGGKSTVVNILEAVIGTFNVTQLRVHLLGERFEVAGFIGKTLLTGKDVPGNFLNNKSAYVLKALVGGDRLNAEQKNCKHRFEVFGEFNVIITANSRLHVRLDGDSGAWRRRLLIIDYENPPADIPIPHFDRRLVEEEGPGILNWCIEGAIRLLDELDESGRMQLTDDQNSRVEALLCESDSVRHFVRNCVEKRGSSDVTVNEMVTAYINFCVTRGWQAVTVRQFESTVSDIMMEIHRASKRTDIQRNNKNQRGYANIALKDQSK
jgi:putative DNA primase/helicase